MIKKRESGFLTLEMLIALTIIVVVISSISPIVFGAESSATDGELTMKALYKATAIQEKLSALSETQWTLVSSFTDHDEIFTDTVSVIDEDDLLKSASIEVSWASRGVMRSVTLNTLLFNKSEAASSGNCSNTALGNWTHLESHDIALDAAGPATGLDVKDGIAYVTVNGNSTQKDFFTIDVATNPASILWSMDTGPGLLAVKVSGNYAYAANTSINGQLQIINLASHSYVGYKIPGSSSGDTANTLYYSNHTVYLGIPKSTIEEFHIIDVSDLNNVHETGKFELNVGINSLYVSNSLAYVATPDHQELKILDVSDPLNIKNIGGYDAPGNTFGKSLARQGKRLYLGRDVGNNELYVLHIDDIGSGSTASAKVGSSITGLAAMGNLIFLATTDKTKEFQVWQISDDDRSLVLTSSIDLSNKATGVDCEHQTVYVTSQDPLHGLTIINSP